ncbi:glycoside hydrolase family 35 protein [Alkalihalobacillus trypoxylicola]|uniref:Uncharacterized protein n=1 Tax=Alkalihalobacillus trypoxylicola TaxID=519424 RepID=A0A162F4M4_9BACI|nr:beta-galactosidase family protein [Alkalihalobacillus trypoxylicola]KYG34794.1 hypothetical protein AZF04_00210 [Alkalihalobacillus trypoxylicola]
MLINKEEKFYLDGKPFQILSGGIHYFRVPPAYWKDRLLKLRALGLNTVETYVPWNFHEPKKGQFHFTGLANIEEFIKCCQELELKLIVRPSPYICAEWEMGGLPSWLLKNQETILRSSETVYLKHVEEYYDVLLPKFKPFLYQNGGPIIAMQIENEYGAYGNDEAYLNFLKQQYEKHGLETFLFTSDGPAFMKQGSLEQVTTTLNFGSKVEEAFEALDGYKPGSPKMVAEFWIGWFDHWGGKHHTRDPKEAARVFEELMDRNSSVNFYMFHGGTNFGFMNGANHYDQYYPTITSYDYDSLLTENGEITEKYKEIKKILSQYIETPENYVSKLKTNAYGDITLTESVSIFDVLSEIGVKKQHLTPLSMESLDQSFGYTLYRTDINRKGTLTFRTDSIRDRCHIYINGRFEKTVYINDLDKEVSLNFPNENNVLELFVENMGRANYGEHLTDQKGLVHNIWLGEQYWFNWEMYSIELQHLPKNYIGEDQRFPKFLKGSFHVDDVADTFVDLKGFKKGNVFINGFNLGRYWEKKGPQHTLYAPGPYLKEGKNELIIVELDGTQQTSVSLIEKPILHPREIKSD